MKNLLMSAVMYFMFLTFAFANTSENRVFVSQVEQDNSRVKVDLVDVPNTIKSSFDQSDFKGSRVLEVYQVSKDGVTMFEFDIETTKEQLAVFFDIDGNYLFSKPL